MKIFAERNKLFLSFVLLVAFICILGVLGGGIYSSYDAYAYNADDCVREAGQKDEVYAEPYFRNDTSIFTAYVEGTPGMSSTAKEKNMFKVSIDDANWISTLLNNDGFGMFVCKRDYGFTRYVPKTENSVEPMLDETQIETIVRHKDSYTLSGSYAKLMSASLSGTDYRGETVTNVDIYDADLKAGVYYVSNVVIQYFFEKPTGPNSTPIENATTTSGTLDPMNFTPTANDPGLVLVLTTTITLDKEQLETETKNNFGLNEEDCIYAGEDLRGRILLSQGMTIDGAPTISSPFYFSSANKGLVKTLGSGLQVESSNNLEQIADYLEIVWYKRYLIDGEEGTSTAQYGYKKEELPIDAGTYAIRIECKYKFEMDAFSPIIVVNGASSPISAIIDKTNQYAASLEIAQAELRLVMQFDEKGQIIPDETYAVTVVMSKGYDTTNDAKHLFSDKTIREFDEVGIKEKDRATLSKEGLQLFDFSGSTFNDASVAKDKIVYMRVVFIEVVDQESDLYKVTQNYNIVPYVNGTRASQNQTTKAYNLGNDAKFEITPTEMQLHFSSGMDIDRKEQFPSNIVYGQYATVNDFVYGDYVVLDNSDVEISANSGIFSVKYRNNWRVVVGRTPDGVVDGCNTLYIEVRVATATDPGNEPDFIDRDGKKYTYYGSTRLYAGSYYFVYVPTILYSNGQRRESNEINIEKARMEVPASKSQNAPIDFIIEFSRIQAFGVDPKALVATVTDIELDKEYDGTNLVYGTTTDGQKSLASAKITGVLDQDLSILEFTYEITYAYAGVGNNVTINYEFDFTQKGGATSVFQNVKRSYSISQTEKINETGKEDITKGTITPKALTVEFVEPNRVYSRGYRAPMYVVVLGDGIPDGTCYYYIVDTKEGGYWNRYSVSADKFNGAAFVTVILSGFLEGEGFGFEGSGLKDFMQEKYSSNPNDYIAKILNSYELLSWRDTRDSENIIEIDVDTNSTADATKPYRLELNEGLAVTNYVLATKESTKYAYLIIEKGKIDSEIKINDATRIEYDKNNHVDELFDTSNGRVDMTGHPEYHLLVGDGWNSFINVEKFVPACNEPQHYHSTIPGQDEDFPLEGINNLKFAGEYTIRLYIRETTNFLSYETYFTVTVSPKDVKVYITMAMRYYSAPALKYANYAYVDDIEKYAVTVDSEGEIITDGREGNAVYLYSKDGQIINENYILYCGFLEGDEIDLTNGDRHAVATEYFPSGIEAAGNDGSIRLSQWLKHNYSFGVGNNGMTLYIKKKPLELIIDNKQMQDYTGSQLTPDYAISDNDPGTLGMYVVGYSPEIGSKPQIDDDKLANQNDTTVIQAGEYILMVYARPDGLNANNYAPSNEILEIAFTVNMTNLILREGVERAESVFSGHEDGYQPMKFNEYFVGQGSYRPVIESETVWGSVVIVNVLSDGQSLSKAIDAGEYELTMKATIAEDQQNNLYFIEGIQRVYETEFTVHLTIHRAFEYNFIVVQSSSVAEKADGNFDMVYNGYDETAKEMKNVVTFGYNLSFAGQSQNDGKLNVLMTVNGVLFSVNGTVLFKNNADDVKRAQDLGSKYAVSGIDYDITKRNSLRDNGEYLLKFYINNEEGENYNKNYISPILEYRFSILKRELLVFLTFDETQFDAEYKQYIPYMIYKTPISEFLKPNAEGNKKYDFVLEGFVRDEGTEETINLAKIGMEIDWSEVPENPSVNADCRIKAMGGTAIPNYYFDYGAAVVFNILPAESKVVVYGNSGFDKLDGREEELFFTFDKIYRYENGEVVSYDNENLSEEEMKAAINQKYYYGYKVYGGTVLKPEVLRMAGDAPINEIEESVGTDGVRIKFIGALKEGVSEETLLALRNGIDVKSVNLSDIVRTGSNTPSDCIDVGEYVFSVSVKASQNYRAVPEKYYYLKVVKASLKVIVKDTINSKVYDGQRKDYPSFAIKYEGFVGRDDNIGKYKNDYYTYHINDVENITGITELGLVSPYYLIYKGEEEVVPNEVGNYTIKLIFNETYGVADNYEIHAEYPIGANGEIYPSLDITRRPVDIAAAATVQKTYDATTDVPEGLITDEHYVFFNVIEGDELSFNIIWKDSSFGRKNVLDDNGKNSITPIKVYYNPDLALSNRNYKFEPSEQLQDEKGYYIILNGLINPARADIEFFKDADYTPFDTPGRLEVTYDKKPHAVYPRVLGVSTKDGREEVAYTLTYSCENLHYDSPSAPILAETYQVRLVITDTNYVSTQRVVELFIDKATVTIVFGGDIVSVYGSVVGLSATAFGVTLENEAGEVVDEDEFVLEVKYYYPDLTPLGREIITADAGEYLAGATFEENANYKYSFQTTTFTIKRREVHANIDVNETYSYTGKNVAVDVYFNYNNVVFRPDLLFGYADGTEFEGTPKNVGKYTVRVNNNMKNFDILEKDEVPFEITKIPLTVKANDLTVTYGDTVSPTYTVSGSVNGETYFDIFKQAPPVEFRLYTTGEKINGVPTEVGTYIITPYNSSDIQLNYVPTYQYGMLVINNGVVSQTVTNSKFDATGEVIVYGSFPSGVTLEVRSTDTMEYNQYITAFASAKANNEELSQFEVFDVYYMRLSDGSVTNSAGEMTIKIYAKYYFESFVTANEEQTVAGPENAGKYSMLRMANEEYTVARISEDGEVTLLRCTREGDYLVITSDKLGAFALLAQEGTLITKDGGNMSWLIYVGIAVGVVLIIGVALIIVKVRA